MSTDQKNRSRDYTVDVMRAIAVILMIFAHTSFFVYSGTNVMVNTTIRFANTITLSLFVFISGISIAKSIKNTGHISHLERNIRMAEYGLILYFSYVAVSLVSLLTVSQQSESGQIPGKIIEILLFTSPPNFTEYMFLFILLPLIALPFSHAIRTKSFDTLHAVILSVICYISGYVLYSSTVTGPLASLKELIAGGSTLLRFPLLFYIPVYVFGIWWEANRSYLPLVIGSTFILFCHLISIIFNLPSLAIDIRWPPSIGFLSIGILSSMFLSYAVSYVKVQQKLSAIYRYLSYVGKDSLDFWISHLVLLFLYRYYVGFHTSNSLVLFLSVIIVLCISTLISSIGITNRISYASIGPISFLPTESRRFRKRYIAIFIFAAIAIFSVVATTKTDTLYGSKLPVNSIFDSTGTSKISSLIISSEKQWHILRRSQIVPITIHVKSLDDYNVPAAIDSELLRFWSGNAVVQTLNSRSTKDGVEVQINANQFPAGVIELKAEYIQKESPLSSNNITINISEPLFVAWTFDWEGWEPDRIAIPTLIDLQSKFIGIPFTHFVNPRTFTTDTISDNQKNEVLSYLLTQQNAKNEIALHLHMQYDFVREAGIEPHSTVHWGLRSQEGYDVPTSEYSDGEFRQIVQYAQKILSKNGFTNVIGYRAGGWFIRPSQLDVLGSLGFAYDSSGRDKPENGAFKNIPWNLPRGAQPYKSSNIYEIPNNGASTFEQSPAELIQRIADVYASGILISPKSLVFVSHPQFASKEFIKIPPILSTLLSQSEIRDSGPIVFTTMSDVYSAWNSR